jgi:cytochrome c oxidase subunit 2
MAVAAPEGGIGMNGSFHWLPPSAAVSASRYDALFYSVIALMTVVALAVIVLILWFCIKYRARSDVDRTAPPSRFLPLEIGWTVTPLAIFLGIYAWAAYDYTELHDTPAGAIPVFVVGKQWMWKLQHTNGRREINELHVPVGKPVHLVMTSQDVIHSFFVPAFRLKQDVVPGRYTSLWFTATKTGEYRLHCAEYCGTDHAAMGGRIVVMQPAQYAQWLASGTPVPGIAAQGFALFREHGCSGCHDPHSSVHAPDLNGLIGRVVHLQDGRSLVADENYVRDSILLPTKDVVAGFAPVMPSFAGQVSEEDIQALVAYLQSTGNGQGAAR